MQDHVMENIHLMILRRMFDPFSDLNIKHNLMRCLCMFYGHLDKKVTKIKDNSKKLFLHTTNEMKANIITKG